MHPARCLVPCHHFCSAVNVYCDKFCASRVSWIWHEPGVQLYRVPEVHLYLYASEKQILVVCTCAFFHQSGGMCHQSRYNGTHSLLCHLHASQNHDAGVLQASWRLPARRLPSCSSSCSRLSSRTRLWPGFWLRGVSRPPAMWSSSSSCKTCGSSWSACMLSPQESLCR